MNERHRTLTHRDQAASAFSAALMRLCEALGALGTALVDSEGETVDYAGRLDPFDIKIAAAELCVLLEVVRHTGALGWSETEEILVRGTRRSFYVRLLGEGYAMIVILPLHAFGVSRRGVAEAVREVCSEAGLEVPHSMARYIEQWLRVDVRVDPSDSRRPDAVWVDGIWCPVEVLGVYRDDPSSREVGYRARLKSGSEITLIRESLGRWYADSRPGK
jgi:hypothetical protein